jgi:protein involved in polysaccharide export with SLBB domain
MTSGAGGWARWVGRSGLWLCLLVGCASGKGHTDATVQASRTPAAAPHAISEQYHACCPDVLDVSVGHSPPIHARISPDGRIDLAALGEVRVEGLTCGEIERRVAAAARQTPDAVHVQVADFKSQQVYIFGEVNGLQRAVPYRGPETVLQLLQRAGGLSQGAEPDDVYVVRSHVASGGQPELFPIHLEEASGKDRRAVLQLEPFDQIYIGETRRSSFRKCLPPWLRPLYESLWGMKETKQP